MIWSGDPCRDIPKGEQHLPVKGGWWNVVFNEQKRRRTQYFSRLEKKRGINTLCLKTKAKRWDQQPPLLLDRNVLTNTGRPKRQPPSTLVFDKRIARCMESMCSPPTRPSVSLLLALVFIKQESYHRSSAHPRSRTPSSKVCVLCTSLHNHPLLYAGLPVEFFFFFCPFGCFCGVDVDLCSHSLIKAHAGLCREEDPGCNTMRPEVWWIVFLWFSPEWKCFTLLLLLFLFLVFTEVAPYFYAGKCFFLYYYRFIKVVRGRQKISLSNFV